MMFAQQQNRLTMYFSEYIPVIKHRMTVLAEVCETHLRSGGDTGRCRSTESM